MTSRRGQPNASYFSARYAERKRAAARARDEAAEPRICNRCPETSAMGSIFCGAHAAEYAALCQRMASGDVTAEDCGRFCERTYWPPEAERKMADARRRAQGKA